MPYFGPAGCNRSATSIEIRAVVRDLEGIVLKHLADAYHPKLARWQKVLNRSYSQRLGRAEWFERQGRGRRY